MNSIIVNEPNTFCGDCETLPKKEVRIKKQGVAHTHIKNESGNYMCPYECAYTSVKLSTMSMHVSRKHGEEAGRQINHFECAECGERFQTGTSRSHHIVARHGTAELKCFAPGCHHKSKLDQSMLTHYVSKHMNMDKMISYLDTSGKMAQCNTCCKQMKTTSIRYHLAKCSIESPYSDAYKMRNVTIRKKPKQQKKIVFIIEEDEDE